MCVCVCVFVCIIEEQVRKVDDEENSVFKHELFWMSENLSIT